MSNYLRNGVAAFLVYGMSYAPTAHADEAPRLIKNLANVVGNAITLPGKVIKSTVKDFNPIDGAVKGTLDLGESVYNLGTGRKAVSQPDQNGKTSQTLEDHPGLNAVVNIAAGAGVGGAIGGARGAAVGGIGQASIEMVNEDAYPIRNEVAYRGNQGKGARR